MTTTKTVFANALAATTFILWLLCTVVYYLAPELYFSIANSWVHGMNTQVLMTGEVTSQTLLIGAVTFTASAWAVGYLFQSMVEQFSRK